MLQMSCGIDTYTSMSRESSRKGRSNSKVVRFGRLGDISEFEIGVLMLEADNDFP